MAQHDDEVGKIFIGGLARQTEDDGLRAYFESFGEVVESIVMKDKVTGFSRGFGFVKFSDQQSVSKVLKNGPHSLDNKKIDPKPCTPKGIQQEKKSAAMEHTQSHKIFIGGIAQSSTTEDVKKYFEEGFGTVNEVVFVINKEDNRHKGFGFVTFANEQAVNKAVDMHFHEIGDKQIEAKRATPREKMPPRSHDNNQGMSNDAYGYGYGGQGPQGGGWMQGPAGANAMMGYGYGYGQGFPTSYPQGYGQGGYYGYGYNPGAYGGMGQMNKGDAGKGTNYSNMGSYQQTTSGYGPARANQSYGGGSDYNNGYGKNGGDASGGGGGGRSSSQGYHPYKR
uniref:Musashi n=1 Tax=Halocynthia roretzi TaxID=7729 RepID=Q9UAF2_HALRO|nr:Musashi [Halocynthia roretzi]